MGAVWRLEHGCDRVGCRRCLQNLVRRARRSRFLTRWATPQAWQGPELFFHVCSISFGVSFPALCWFLTHAFLCTLQAWCSSTDWPIPFCEPAWRMLGTKPIARSQEPHQPTLAQRWLTTHAKLAPAGRTAPAAHRKGQGPGAYEPIERPISKHSTHDQNAGRARKQQEHHGPNFRTIL